MSPVFSHGRLRLYLLKLLAEQPRHGYELMRLLEDRFMGLYAPSAGTIYPRLARLEAEGLIEHTAEGGRKTYRITDAGREELGRRQDELDSLEQEIRSSVYDLAQEIRDEVRASARDLSQELRDAAREVRGRGRAERRNQSWRDLVGEWTSGWETGGGAGGGTGAGAGAPGWVRPERGGPVREVERLVEEFAGAARRAARDATDDDDVATVAGILDDTLTRIRGALRKPE